MTRVELTFECCGHSFEVDGPGIGKHGDYCLRCNTEYPDVTKKRV